MAAHIDSRISQVAQPILAKLDSVQSALNDVQSTLGAKIDAMAQVKSETEKAVQLSLQWARWITVTPVAAIGATLATLKAMGYL